MRGRKCKHRCDGSENNRSRPLYDHLNYSVIDVETHSLIGVNLPDQNQGDAHENRALDVSAAKPKTT